MSERTQVGIVGAGPAGLVLGQLLHQRGIDTVILEDRSRDYVEHRVRAGVLEHATVELLKEIGVGERLEREGLVHEGVELRFGGVGHRIDFHELTGGRSITIYGQQEVVKDLIAARLDAGAPLLFEVEDVRVDPAEARIRYRQGGQETELACEVIAGCDGFHGVCRDSAPEGALRIQERVWPFAWLGILVEAPPSSEELIYCHHDRGFALASLRSPEITRLYLQCDPEDEMDVWPEERIWEELRTRLAADGFELNEGPILESGITPMRSFVTEPMQHERLYLAGDAVHIVPPTGAKGLNLAVADVRVLAEALGRWFESGDDSGLNTYSDTCLRRVWRTQFFSYWMTQMLHRMPDDRDGFQARLQRAQLDYVTSSEAGARSLAENYVGPPLRSEQNV